MKRLWRETVSVRLWALRHVRVLWFVQPTVLELDDQRCVIRIPLTWRTRNHLHSMYVGVLAVGADCAGGLMAMRRIEQSDERIRLSFKDLRAEFLKRAEGDVHFTCEDGAAIAALVDQVATSGERGNLPVRVVATVPTRLGDEAVARFELTLSLKTSTARGTGGGRRSA
jgi:acyl-coenzyme A thioesterase PaaI-like protein